MTEVFQETAQQNTLHAHPSRVSFACIPDRIYFVPLEALDLSVRLFNIFRRARVSLVGQILEMDRAALEMLKLGERSIDEVTRRIKALGLLDPDESRPTVNEARIPLQIRFAYEVAVSLIPDRYRERLPRRARTCFMEEPFLNPETDTYTTRIAPTPQALATARAITLRQSEQRQQQELTLFQGLVEQAIASPQALTARSVRVAPATFLPMNVKEICHESTIVTLEQEEILMPDVFYLAETGITKTSATGEPLQLVNVSALPERLTGHQSGPVHSVWMSQVQVAQSPLLDDELVSLDSHDLRMQVVEDVRTQGGIIPTSRPLAGDTSRTKEDTVAITNSSLQQDFHLVPLKDPIFLRKEDVCKENVVETDDPMDILEKDPVDLLEKAVHAVETQHDAIVAQMRQRIEEFQHAETPVQQQELLIEQKNDQRKAERLEILRGWLEETMIWYTNLSIREKPPIVEITPVLLSRNAVPVRDGSGKVRRDKNGKRLFTVDEEWAYLLTIEVPTTLSLPPKMLMQPRKKPIFHAPKPIEYGSKPPIIVPKSVQFVAA